MCICLCLLSGSSEQYASHALFSQMITKFATFSEYLLMKKKRLPKYAFNTNNYSSMTNKKGNPKLMSCLVVFYVSAKLLRTVWLCL